ncbi:MAG TPA: hypothetical protein VGK00_15430 [Anaerolineales bacterium]
MNNPTTMINYSVIGSTSYLRNEYERQQTLLNSQPGMVRHFLESQAQHLANALINEASQVRFTLPDRVVDKTPQFGEMAAMLVPPELREQTSGDWRMRLEHRPLREALRETLSRLEQSPDQAISTSAALLRFATASHMVHNMLPAGRAVKYFTAVDDQIPSIPEQMGSQPKSALTAATDAIAEQGDNDEGRGDLLTPFVPAARRFYLPQWVVFDDDGNLLVSSVAEAEACILSMQRYVAILHASSSLASYMVADEEYQRKRYGILGQVVNQGRALARFKTGKIIESIQERVNEGTLNRGLSINLPYYDDQNLRMNEIRLEIIPAGRIMFKSIFVVRAARLEQAKVSQDTRLNISTRNHLLQELIMLEQAFIIFNEKGK